MPIDKFKENFKFSEDKRLYFGIERELFITRDEVFLPIADKILEKIQGREMPTTWTHEFSACALEQTIGPAYIDNLTSVIDEMDKSRKLIESEFDVKLKAYEVAPESIPKDVYPDPSGRYKRIAEVAENALIDAATRTCAIHVHIGLGNHEEALLVHQQLCQKSYIEYLISIGDNSNRKRIELIKNFTEWEYKTFENWEEFYAHLDKKGLLHDLKSYRPLVRLTRHGTIEFRMFGSTDSQELIEFYVRTCYNLVKHALANKKDS